MINNKYLFFIKIFLETGLNHFDSIGASIEAKIVHFLYLGSIIYMSKFIPLLLSLLIVIGCNTSKLYIENSRITNIIQQQYPSQPCACSTSDPGFKIPLFKKPNKYSFFWTSIVLNNKSDLEIIKAKAAGINQSLQDSLPVLNYYQVLLQQYLVYDSSIVNPAERYVTLGTHYFIRNRCEGFLPNTKAKDITKKIFKPHFIKKLCN